MLFLYLLYIFFARISKLRFSLATKNLKRKRDLRAHKTSLKFSCRVGLSERVTRLPQMLRTYVVSPTFLSFYSKPRTVRFNLRRPPTRGHPLLCSVTRGTRRPIFFKTRRRLTILFCKFLEYRLSKVLGSSRFRCRRRIRLLSRRLIRKLVRRRRRRLRRQQELLLYNYNKKKSKPVKHRPKAGPPPRSSKKKGAVSSKNKKGPVVRRELPRRRKRRRAPKYYRFYSLRRRYKRYPGQPAKLLALEAITHFPPELSLLSFAETYATYKLFVKFVRRFRRKRKRIYLRPAVFLHDDFYFLFNLLKSIRSRRAADIRGRFPRRRWRYFYIKRRFIRKLRSRRQYFLRRTQSLDSADFLFLNRLTRLLYKHKIFAKTIDRAAILTGLIRDYDNIKEGLLHKHYYLVLRRKRSNFYFTVINHLGRVIYSISVGRFVKKNLRRRNRKLRVGYTHYAPIIRLICSALRKKKIFKIHTVFKPSSIRPYVLRRIINGFLTAGIKIMNINYIPKMAHGRAPKNKKVRRL